MKHYAPFAMSVLSVVTVTAVGLTLPPSAAAQQFGVKAGVNFASLTPEEEDESPNISRRPGVVGLYLRIPMSL